MAVERIQKIGVVGAGTMGHGIAQVFAQNGFPVSLTDAVESVLAEVKKKIHSNLILLAKEGLVSDRGIEQTLDRISIVKDLNRAVRDADFVTEAIVENLEVKQDTFKKVEGFCSPATILASNSSTLRITDISSTMSRPERAVTTHWFNPPYIVPLVEVVRGARTSDETFNIAYDLLNNIGKVAVKIQKEIPGFLVNRIQAAMYREVVSLAEMGVASMEDIDLAIKSSMGFRLASFGALRIMDMGGLDIWYKVFEHLLKEIDSKTEVPKFIKDKAERGELGVKTGKGFFEYTPESIQALIKERDRQFVNRLKTLYYSQEKRERLEEALKEGEKVWNRVSEKQNN